MPNPGEQMLAGMVQDALSRIGVLLNTLFETAQDAIFLMDGIRFLDCNPATLQMFGCTSKEEVVGRTPLDFSPTRQPDGSPSGPKAGHLVAEAMAGIPQQFEWLHSRLNRTTFLVEVRLNRFLVRDTPFLVAVVRDISMRKRAEEASLQEKLFSERLIDSLPGIFYLYDFNLRLRRWNKNHEQMGYTPEELSGKRMEEWFATDESRREAIEIARRILQNDLATEFLQTEILYKDGARVPYLCSGARVDSPSGPMLLGVGINVTKLIQAERALAASERSYRELFNATNDALLIQDRSGHVLEVNERACAMFGFDAAEARRLSFADLSFGKPPYSRTEALEEIHRTVREGPQVFDWRSRRIDGTLFWSEIALRAFRVGGEERIIASIRDITDRKRFALERERLLQQLQSSSHAKDQFLAVLSHELRNPLAAIRAGADVLHFLPRFDDPRAARAVDVIERNVELQARLVDDLLDLSRLVRGKLPIRRSKVKLDPIVVSAAQACGGDARRAGITLETRTDSGVFIEADADRIQQVVTNLVENSVKFTPRGGRVTISVAASDDHGRIIVDDTGVGIEPERLQDLFELFRQGETTAKRAQGPGIGLAIVKSLVELHGGRVWAESPGPGRGSRFTVELPRCEPPPSTGTRERALPSHQQIKMLLVEDNDDTRAMLAETFSQRAYQVLAARSGEVALDILAREPVDVIVADIGLPGMDGYEFLSRAHQLPAAAGAFAVALTGYGQETDIERAREAGYACHFVKPLDAEQIDQRIRSCLASAG